MSPSRGVVIPATHVDRARAVEDVALLAQLGAKTIRIGVDWAWMQPTAGAVDGDAVEFYRGLAQAARAADVTLQLALLERDVPNWFDNDGGFADDKWASHWWPRWVEVCAENFGDDVGGWVPIDHPLAVANRLFPNDPRRHGDVLDTLVTAWRDAWRILRGGPPVTTSFGLEIVRATDETVEAAEAARRMDQIRFTLWLQGLHDGIASIPGRADREVADLAGSCDVVGIIVRHERDTLGLLHRTAEEGLGDRPLAVTLLAPTGADANREVAVERYVEQADEAATGMPVECVSISPTFDLPGDERGIITRDRNLKDSGRLLFGVAS